MSFFEDFANSTSADRSLVLRKNGIALYQLSHYHYLCSGGNVIQGVLDTLAPSSVLSPVVDAMLTGLQIIRPVESVLNLGLGCAAIERYLQAKQATLSVETVECSQDVIDLCTQTGLLPDGCTPVAEEAAQFLANTSKVFDAVLCDLATGDQQPDLLCSESFYAACKKRMTSHAVLMVNVLCADNEALSKVCLAARKVFSWTAVVDISGFDNVVLFASAAAPASGVERPVDTYEAELKTQLSQIQILP